MQSQKNEWNSFSKCMHVTWLQSRHDKHLQLTLTEGTRKSSAACFLQINLMSHTRCIKPNFWMSLLQVSCRFLWWTVSELRALLGTEAPSEGVWGAATTGTGTFAPGAPGVPQGVSVLFRSGCPGALHNTNRNHLLAVHKHHVMVFLPQIICRLFGPELNSRSC